MGQRGFDNLQIGSHQQLSIQPDQRPTHQPRLLQHKLQHFSIREFLAGQSHLFQAGASPGEELGKANVFSQPADFRFGESVLEKVPFLKLHAPL